VNIRLVADPILGGYLGPPALQSSAKPLRISCALQFLSITIYGILPNFPRQTFVAVSAVKIGFLQKPVFSIDKPYFAANLYNFRL
jgi:hypothetical protein